MGLFDFLRKQYRKVIQWENDNPQSIVWKYPLERKEEIMRNSVLVVREGQKAMFIQEGKLADVFGPGTYKLEDIKNIQKTLDLLDDDDDVQNVYHNWDM